MRTSIQVSMFQTGFPEALAAVLRKKIPENARFAFVASEFELLHEKTDKYFRRFLDMFTACGIEFAESRVVDGRMTPEELLQLSRQHELYGICDEAAIIVDETGTRYIGNVVRISGGKCERLSTH